MLYNDWDKENWASIVIVIGGGTSRVNGVGSAAMHGAEVMLLEKNPTLGKKLLHTGGTHVVIPTNRRTQKKS